MFTGGDGRQRSGEGARQVAPDVGNLFGDQIKVVEQPVGGRGHELSGADVFGERAVSGPQDADVVLEARKGIPWMAARVGIERETGSQGERPALQRLGTEELVAKRFQNLRTRPERRPHDAVATCAPRTVDTTVERSRQSP